MSKVTPRQYREALRQYATGVTIVTTLDDEGRSIGLTVNSFTSVSLDPPQVLWCADKSVPFYEEIVNASHFAVRLLRHDQASLAARFADDSIDKFAGLTTKPGINGLPLLDGSSTLLQCETVGRHEAGDHTVLVGLVQDIQLQAAEPLVFFASQYRWLGK